MTLDYIATYTCMFNLLDIYWEKTKLDDLGGLLGSMNPDIFTDGIPVDEKLLSDWILVSCERERISEIEGYHYMMEFLEKQEVWLDLSTLLIDLKVACEKKNDYWTLWTEMFSRTINSAN